MSMKVCPIRQSTHVFGWQHQFFCQLRQCIDRSISRLFSWTYACQAMPTVIQYWNRPQISRRSILLSICNDVHRRQSQTCKLHMSLLHSLAFCLWRERKWYSQNLILLCPDTSHRLARVAQKYVMWCRCDVISWHTCTRRNTLGSGNDARQ